MGHECCLSPDQIIVGTKGGEPEGALLEVDGVETAVPFIAEECRKEAKAFFREKEKEEIEKLEVKLQPTAWWENEH